MEISQDVLEKKYGNLLCVHIYVHICIHSDTTYLRAVWRGGLGLLLEPPEWLRNLQTNTLESESRRGIAGFYKLTWQQTWHAGSEYIHCCGNSAEPQQLDVGWDDWDKWAEFRFLSTESRAFCICHFLTKSTFCDTHTQTQTQQWSLCLCVFD